MSCAHHCGPPVRYVLHLNCILVAAAIPSSYYLLAASLTTSKLRPGCSGLCGMWPVGPVHNPHTMARTTFRLMRLIHTMNACNMHTACLLVHRHCVKRRGHDPSRFSSAYMNTYQPLLGQRSPCFQADLFTPTLRRCMGGFKVKLYFYCRRNGVKNLELIAIYTV